MTDHIYFPIANYIKLAYFIQKTVATHDVGVVLASQAIPRFPRLNEYRLRDI